MSPSNAKSTLPAIVLETIVSGGQTGVDRAALDAAMEAGIAVGGWCPRGRRSESGLIPSMYPLTETGSRNYSVRTEWNVRDSDGTLILVLDEVSSGTKLTANLARQQAKPLLIVYLRPADAPSLFTDENSLTERIDSVVDWIRQHRIRVLNVAGPRGSSHQDMYPESYDFMHRMLQQIKTRKPA